MKYSSYQFLSVLTIFSAITLSAADTPMEVFSRFRQAAIKNDQVAALELSSGEMLNKVINGGIPLETRQMLINTLSAFEDAYVRMSDPNEAAVYLTFDNDGKKTVMKAVLQNDGSGNFKIIRFTRGNPPAAKFFAERFFTALKNGQTEEIKEYLTEELFEKFQQGKMPGLKNPADTSLTPTYTSNTSAVFSANRQGLQGKVTMSKNGYFWQITAIDDILCMEPPSKQTELFIAYVAVFARQADDAAIKLIADADKGEEPDDADKAVECALAYFAENGSSDDKQSVKELARKFTDNRAVVTVRYTQNGVDKFAKISVIKENEEWKADSASSNNADPKPAVIQQTTLADIITEVGVSEQFAEEVGKIRKVYFKHLANVTDPEFLVIPEAPAPAPETTSETPAENAENAETPAEPADASADETAPAAPKLHPTAEKFSNPSFAAAAAEFDTVIQQSANSVVMTKSKDRSARITISVKKNSEGKFIVTDADINGWSN